MTIAQEMDGVIIVVTGNATRRKSAKALVARLRSNGAALLGAILLRRPTP